MMKFRINSVCSVNEQLKDLSYYVKDFSNLDNKIDLSFSFEIENRSPKSGLIDVFIHVAGFYRDEQIKEYMFLHYDIVSTYKIENYSDIIKKTRSSKSKYSIEVTHATTLVSIAFSNARGYLAAAINGVYGELFVLPIIYPASVVKNRRNKIKKDRYYFNDLSFFELNKHAGFKEEE